MSQAAIDPFFEKLIYSKLPNNLAVLADKYPLTISAIAYYWNEEPLPQDYIPRYIEISSSEDLHEPPELIWNRGKIARIELSDQRTEVTRVCFDHSLVYVEIEGKVIFNRIDNLREMPAFGIKADVLATEIARAIAQQTF